MAGVLLKAKNLCEEEKVVPNVRRQIGGGEERRHEDEHLDRLRLLLVELGSLVGVLATRSHLLSVPDLANDRSIPEDDQSQGDEVLGDHQNEDAHLAENQPHRGVLPDDAAGDQALNGEKYRGFRKVLCFYFKCSKILL